MWAPTLADFTKGGGCSLFIFFSFFFGGKSNKHTDVDVDACWLMVPLIHMNE